MVAALVSAAVMCLGPVLKERSSVEADGVVVITLQSIQITDGEDEDEEVVDLVQDPVTGPGPDDSGDPEEFAGPPIDEPNRSPDPILGPWIIHSPTGRR